MVIFIIWLLAEYGAASVQNACGKSQVNLLDFWFHIVIFVNFFHKDSHTGEAPDQSIKLYKGMTKRTRGGQHVYETLILIANFSLGIGSPLL